MNYAKTQEIAKLWGVTERQVQVLCKAGKVDEAIKFGNTWAIPLNAEKPTESRTRKSR